MPTNLPVRERVGVRLLCTGLRIPKLLEEEKEGMRE